MGTRNLCASAGMTGTRSGVPKLFAAITRSLRASISSMEIPISMTSDILSARFLCSDHKFLGDYWSGGGVEFQVQIPLTFFLCRTRIGAFHPVESLIIEMHAEKRFRAWLSLNHRRVAI